MVAISTTVEEAEGEAVAAAALGAARVPPCLDSYAQLGLLWLLVDLALEAMDTFPGDESMQKAGCWLLGAVAIEHLEGHRMVLTAGGLRAVLEMMRRFGNSVDSQVTGCFALTSLGLLHNKASGVPERYVGAILV